MNRFLWLALCATLSSAISLRSQPGNSAAETTSDDGNFADYFRRETAAISERCLAGISTLSDWESRKAEYRRQLQEMLGLWPMPARTDLKAVITGRLEQDDFAVEKLHFQASPHLYVTANLYLPKRLEKPAPAILYVCGHSRVVTNGVSCGCKAYYQHHGAWFARNGYVCLMIDTVQLGEIQGTHHGTYTEGQWWWNSRGYTPAGVEAWFGIRALDYLCSRPEVDKDRIGMTGRSGGGSYTWTVAALDDRVKVAAPVAGMTDLQNQVVDGAVEGHCDCMFFVNTYRWNFPQVAALIAPRPLLIGNSDKDTIFPLDGVVRLYYQARRIYQLYGQTNKLALLITEGPHADTQDLQLPVFRWFNRFLKGEDPVIEMAAKRFFSPEQLRVFDQLPADEINTKIQESFVPQAVPPGPAAGAAECRRFDSEALAALRQKTFGGWPAEPAKIHLALKTERNEAGIHLWHYTIQPQPGIELPLFVLEDAKVRKPRQIQVQVLDSERWTNSPEKNLWQHSLLPEDTAGLRQRMQNDRVALAFFAPRGVEPAPWMNNPKKAVHVRRRFMLLGQTLDGMRAWDIRCAVEALQSLPRYERTTITAQASRQMGINTAYAALFEPTLSRLDLSHLPRSHREGPDYLNVLKSWDIPQALELLGDRVHIN
jgi:dienelactone hydrolase